MTLNNLKTRHLKYLANFQCDSSKCMQNCCSTYSIWVDNESIDLYRQKAPELLDNIVHNQNVTDRYKKYVIPSNDRGCFLLKNNLCLIHRDYGTEFLPEVCYSYPRLYYQIKNENFITSNLLCDYLNAIILSTDEPFAWLDTHVDRIPADIDELDKAFNDYSQDELIKMSATFINMINDKEYSSEESVIRLIMIARLLDEVEKKHWPELLDNYLNIANKKNVLSKYHDTYNNPAYVNREFTDTLLHIMFSAQKDIQNEKLEANLKAVAALLSKYDNHDLREKWEHLQDSTQVEKVLKTYLQARLMEAIYPIFNWKKCLDDIALIASSYSLLRLILIAKEDQMDHYNNISLISKDIAITESIFYVYRMKVYDQLKKFALLNSNKLIAVLIDM